MRKTVVLSFSPLWDLAACVQLPETESGEKHVGTCTQPDNLTQEQEEKSNEEMGKSAQNNNMNLTSLIPTRKHLQLHACAETMEGFCHREFSVYKNTSV